MVGFAYSPSPPRSSFPPPSRLSGIAAPRTTPLQGWCEGGGRYWGGSLGFRLPRPGGGAGARALRGPRHEPPTTACGHHTGVAGAPLMHASSSMACSSSLDALSSPPLGTVVQTLGLDSSPRNSTSRSDPEWDRSTVDAICAEVSRVEAMFSPCTPMSRDQPAHGMFVPDADPEWDPETTAAMCAEATRVEAAVLHGEQTSPPNTGPSV